VSDLMKLPEGNRYFGEMITGVDTRYDLGDDDPLVGTLVSDQPLALEGGGEARLYALMERGGGLFVSPRERSLPQGVRHARTREGPSMLVRPDGCVAWAEASSKNRRRFGAAPGEPSAASSAESDFSTSSEASSRSLDDALARWF